MSDTAQNENTSLKPLKRQTKNQDLYNQPGDTAEFQKNLASRKLDQPDTFSSASSTPLKRSARKRDLSQMLQKEKELQDLQSEEFFNTLTFFSEDKNEARPLTSLELLTNLDREVSRKEQLDNNPFFTMSDELSSLHLDLAQKKRNQEALNKADFIQSESILNEMQTGIPSQDEMLQTEVLKTYKQQEQEKQEQEEKEDEDIFKDFKEVEEEDFDSPIDPESSYVDDTDYDLYEDRKRFWLHDYLKVEDYLEQQAKQGFEYEKHEGKKYYFHQARPRNYYFQLLYFANEPVQAQWDLWAKDGWELIGREAGKSKREAGWYFVRNVEKEGEYRKSIDNEEEKYRYFRKQTSSYRSTEFLLFIVMVCSAITLFLQIQFQGYPIGIALCGVLFGITLIVFIFYGSMMRKVQKQARLLKARIRLRETPLDEQYPESDEELESDWKALEEKSAAGK